MAKKTQDKLDSEFDFDAEFGGDDFDFDLPDPTVKDDRKPLIKIKEGFKEGVKETLQSREFAISSAKKLFPTGYGQAYDEADRIGQTFKNLYDESAQAIRPAIKQAKQIATRLVPADAKYLPPMLQKVLKKWEDDAKSESGAPGNVEGNNREALLSANLNDLFKAQTVQGHQDRVQDKADSDLQRGVESIRHKSVLEVLNRTSLAVTSLDNYQRNIGVNYQKQSLTLQYRQLFALEDIRSDYAKDTQKRDSILLAISKNTSLPEYAKIRDSEARKQAIKNKFYDSIAQGLYGGRNQYIEKTLSGIKKNVGGAIKNSAQGFMSGLTELSMMIDMTDGAGIDPMNMAGNVAGAGAATGLGHALAKRLGKGLVGSKLDKMWNISGKGHKLMAGVDNMPNWLNEFRKSGKYAWGDTLKDKGLSVLQGLLPSMAPDTQTEISRGGDMNAPFHLTKRTDRSINEIIPGFLARILRELQIVRSGNNKIPLIEYDHDKNGFSRTDTVVKGILNKAVPTQAVATTQARLNGILSMVDPRNELSPEVRSAIKKRLLFNSADNNLASRDRLAEENQYSGASPEVAKEAATHMTDYFNHAGDEKLKDFQMAHNQLSRDIADPRAHLQQEIELGHLQHLSKLGLVNAKTGQIDLAKILTMYLDERNGQTKPDEKRFAELSPNLNDGPQGEFVGPQEPTLRKVARRVKEAAASATGAYENRDELIRKGKRKVKKASVRARRVGRDVTEFAQDQVAEAGQDLHTLRDQVYDALEEHPKLQEAFLASEQQAQKAGDHVAQAYNTIKKKGKRAVARGRKATQGLFTQAEPLQGNGSIEEDLYVGSEEEPRIKAIRIPAGGYYIKSTGVVVDRYDQLTDDVYDWDTNKIVVSKSELAQLHTLDVKTGKMQSIAEASAAVAKAATAAVKDTKITRETFSQAGVKNLAKGMADTFKTELADQLDAPTGVKVEGEEAERISMSEMKEGSCIDVETNTPITRPSQIGGIVKNKLGQVVVRMEDLPKLRFFNVRIGKYTPLWFAGKLLKKALHWQLVGAPKMAARNLVRLGRFYKNAGTAVVKGALWLAGVRPGNQPEDLYLPGQVNPIIIGKIMANGGYFGVGFNGRILKPVMRPADIMGELRDEHGQVVLTNEQFRQGLYNIKGRKVSKSFLGRLIKGALALPFKVAGKLVSMPAKAAWEATKLAARGSGALLGGLGKGLAKTAGGVARGAGWLAGIRYEGSKEEREELLKKRRMSSGQRVDLVDPEAPEKPTEPTTIKQAAEEVKQEVAETPKGPARDAKGRFVKKATGPQRDAKGRFVKKADADKDIVETKIPGATLDKLEAKDSGKLKDIKRKTGMSREEAERIRQLKDSDILAEEASEEIKERKAKKLRSGSYEDKLARAKDTAKQLTTKDGIKGLVQQAKDKASAATKGYGIHDLISDATDAKDAAKGAWKGAKTGGSWLARHAKSLLGLGKGAAGLAAGAEGLSALGGLGAAGTAAAGTAAAVEGTAVAGAAAAAGGGTLLASLGAGALAVIGSPITISVLAAGLLGYGLYKGIKYLRKGHLSEIGQLRCVQYGFAADDTSHARAIVNFEAAMIPLVKAGGADGKLTIDEAKIQLKDCLKIFDLEPGNQLHVQSFIAWYNNRFKPVFLTHESAIKGLTGKTDLDAADDLKAEDKKKYLDAVSFASGPYNVAILPIADLKSIKATTADDVKKAVKVCYDVLAKSGSRVAKTATAVAGALTGSTAAQAAGLPGQNDPTLPGYKAPGAAANDPKIMTSVASSIGVTAMSNGKPLDALEAIRFKTYGLKELTPDKVNALEALEKLLETRLKFGSKGEATLDIDAGWVLNQVSNQFGLSTLVGKAAFSWYTWFQKRFLPAYLVFVTAYRARTGKTTPSQGSAALRPQDQLEIAKLIVGTKGVWSVTDSPWQGIELGTSDAIVKDNLAFLQDQSAKAVLTEQKKVGGGATSTTAPAAQTVRQQAEATRTMPSIDRQPFTAPSPDAEAPVKTEAGVPGISESTATATGLVLAAGDMSEGRNANAFVRLGRNVKLDGMNSQMKTQLMGLIEEYGNLTGKATTINDGYRSYEDQAALYRSNPEKAAKPGSSMHEYGLAVDINQGTLNEMDKLGLLRKYGFIRPVGKEPWHMEPIGTQANLELYKKDQQAATTAILNGAGKGGGGWGTERDAIANSRNLKLAQSIMDASVTETDPKQASKLKGGFNAPVTQPAISFGNFADRTKVGATDAPADPNSVKTARWHADTTQNAQIGTARTALASANDAEYQVKKPSAPLSTIGNPDADPTAKVPDPQGSGLAGVRDTILGAAKLVGVDGNLMLQTAAVESDFNPNASPGNTSAQGLFQDTRATWEELINKYGKKYGYTLQNTSPTDVKASAILNAHFLKDNLEALGRDSARPLNAADAYAMHLLGKSGGQKFLTALAQNPNAMGAEEFASAAKSNPNLFYRGGQALSLQDVYSNLTDVIRKKSQAYGLSTGTIQVAAAAENKFPPKPSNGAMIGAGPAISPSAMPISTRGQPSSMAPAIIGAGTAPMMQPPRSYLPPSYAAAPTQPIIQPQHVLDGKAFSKSEDLLSKSLDVQTIIKDTLIDLAKAIKDNQKSGDTPAAEPASNSPNNQTFQAPKPRVSMQRNRFGG